MPETNIEVLISRIKSLEEENRSLKQSVNHMNGLKRHLTEIFNNTPAPIYMKDCEGRYVIINKRFETVSQISLETIIGKRDEEIFPEEISTLFRGQDEEVKRNNRSMEFYETISLPDREYSFLTLKFPVHDADGTILGVAGFCTDITEQKKNEAELAKATEAAEVANRAKSDFLANISHEIRNPMTAIMGMAQILELTELSAEQKHCLEIIKISSENLLALISDVLDLSKIEAGKIELELTEFSLRECISDIMKTQTPLIAGKGLVLNIEMADDLPDHLIGDRLKLQQILLNLVGNAIKFTSNGTVDVEVGMEERRSDYIQLRICVTDTGIGIKPEVIEKIFNPFTQADASTTKTFGGTGLGLFICRRLVELMEGRISVSSNDGAGSTFEVVIPFTVINDRSTESVKSEKINPVSWDGAPLTILLVEDNDINCKLFIEFLQIFGHTLEIARNGLEAIAKWEQMPFDLILMDVQMPLMDGIEATSIIRERERVTGSHVPIIALTAHILRQEQVDFLFLGFDGYVSKPMKLKDLNEEIRRCVDENRLCR